MLDDALDLNTYIYLQNSRPLGELRFSKDETRIVEGSLTFMDLHMVNDITKAKPGMPWLSSPSYPVQQFGRKPTSSLYLGERD